MKKEKLKYNDGAKKPKLNRRKKKRKPNRTKKKEKEKTEGTHNRTDQPPNE